MCTYPVNSVKLAQCSDLQCYSRLSSGEFGHGRDKSVVWLEEQGLMYISILDYDKTGQNKKARVVNHILVLFFLEFC